MDSLVGQLTLLSLFDQRVGEGPDVVNGAVPEQIPAESEQFGKNKEEQNIGQDDCADLQCSLYHRFWTPHAASRPIHNPVPVVYTQDSPGERLPWWRLASSTGR